MKLRIKYTNTQKFTVELEEPTFGNLKQTVLSYISSTYKKTLESIGFSFNGKDTISGSDDEKLSNLGIVNGDLLIVHPSCEVQATVNDVLTKMSVNTTKDEDPQRSQNVGDGSGGKVSNLLEAVDGKPPKSVFDYFERYSPSTASEALNILIHITMLEAGFVLGESPNNSKALPPSWKEMAATFKYHSSGFQDFVCTVVSVSMGNVTQVLASFPGQESEISVKLSTKEYFCSGEIVPTGLTKLSQLARLLRNKLLYPLQVAAHLTLGVPAPWHLAGLPQEILIKILSLLNLSSVLNVSRTCKRLQASSSDNKLWYNLFKRDFRDQYHVSDTVSGADWKAKYKAVYERKVKEKRNREQYPFLIGSIPRPTFPPTYPNPEPSYPFMPQPTGPSPYYPPQPDPDPQPNPYWDPDSPYFGGEIPPAPGPCFPGIPNPFGGRRPNRPNPPMNPFLPPRPGSRRGPRFDFY